MRGGPTRRPGGESAWRVARSVERGPSGTTAGLDGQEDSTTLYDRELSDAVSCEGACAGDGAPERDRRRRHRVRERSPRVPRCYPALFVRVSRFLDTDCTADVASRATARVSTRDYRFNDFRSSPHRARRTPQAPHIAQAQRTPSPLHATPYTVVRTRSRLAELSPSVSVGRRCLHPTCHRDALPLAPCLGAPARRSLASRLSRLSLSAHRVTRTRTRTRIHHP